MHKENIALHPDERLSIIRTSSGPETECKRKNIKKLLKESGLNLSFKMNLKSVDIPCYMYIFNEAKPIY